MGVRYWEDCDFSEDNGKTWEESDRIKSLMPHVVRNDYWELIIDLDTGKVLNWPEGFCIRTYFKVCDDGEYVFLDRRMDEVLNITEQYEQYYVPNFLALEDSGYGDYVIINIDGNGEIEHFDRMIARIKDYFNDIEN